MDMILMSSTIMIIYTTYCMSYVSHYKKTKRI